jgi:hypothetical protein
MNILCKITLVPVAVDLDDIPGLMVGDQVAGMKRIIDDAFGPGQKILRSARVYQTPAENENANNDCPFHVFMFLVCHLTFF